MYETLIQKITTILESVAEVELITYTPQTKFDKFPAVVFMPDGFTNSFLTGSQNFKVYRFMMMVVIGTNGSDTDTVFGTVLPKTVDAIVAAFDTQWDMNTISGHRTWVKIDSADGWGVSQEQDGTTCVAQMNVEIKVSTSV